jgi:hypothetical protein
MYIILILERPDSRIVLAASHQLPFAGSPLERFPSSAPPVIPVRI